MLKKTLATLASVALLSGVPAHAAIFTQDFTGGTNNAAVPGWNNPSGDTLLFNSIGGVTYLDSSNNGLNRSTQNFAGFESNVSSFTVDYVIRTTASVIEFGIGNQSGLNGGAFGSNDFLLGIHIWNSELRLLRPNDTGTADQQTSSLEDPANNTLVSVRLEVDVVNDLVDVFYDTGAGGATTQVVNDLALNWDGLVTDTSEVNRWIAATRTGTGLRDVTITTTVIPEPASIALLAAGTLCLLPRRRRG